MNHIQKYTTLRLAWKQVDTYISNLVSALLGRTISCQTRSEDGGYWSVSAINDRFANTEIVSLVTFVQGSEKMLQRSLPTDSNSSRSLDMELCRALLQRALDLEWVIEHPDDALWITGHFGDLSKFPELDRDLIPIGSQLVDCSQLYSKDAFVARLFAEGGTLTELVDICEEYEQDWGSLLYWMYPISDGDCNGCYFVLVKEGVLVLPYDEISDENHEVFIPERTRLCSAEELSYFMDDWSRFSDEMRSTLSTLQRFLQRLEGAV